MLHCSVRSHSASSVLKRRSEAGVIHSEVWLVRAMKAIAVQQYGGRNNSTSPSFPSPSSTPDQVLVRVKSAGVNPVDWEIAAGYLDPLMNVHFLLILGWDVSGVVVSVGAAVWEYQAGDEVIGYVRKDEVQHGTYAELVAAPVRTLVCKPMSMDWHQAAGLPLAGLTAYQSLKRVDATRGETVLIHAAAGGVGSLGVQIAVAKGLRVIGTASERNHDFLRTLGAEPVAHKRY